MSRSVAALSASWRYALIDFSDAYPPPNFKFVSGIPLSRAAVAPPALSEAGDNPSPERDKTPKAFLRQTPKAACP